ncbi:hypothetical protein GCM10023195_43900 [Actinoallomurus liliacearum]|uniref:Uncharacterized protein n=1 Tax=Actinoallomurus liliacearum TaxID=1080073 RepID=A0ABP8TPP4_9ACTN
MSDPKDTNGSERNDTQNSGQEDGQNDAPQSFLFENADGSVTSMRIR